MQYGIRIDRTEVQNCDGYDDEGIGTELVVKGVAHTIEIMGVDGDDPTLFAEAERADICRFISKWMGHAKAMNLPFELHDAEGFWEAVNEAEEARAKA